MWQKINNLRQMQHNPLVLMEQSAHQTPVAAVHLPWITAYLATDPAVAEDVLVNHARSYGKITRGYRIMRKMLGNGLVTSDGEFWLKQRRTAQPAFHRERIAGLSERMTSITEHALSEWKMGTRFDVHEAMMDLTVRIVANTLLSTDVSATGEIGAAVGELLSQAIWRATHPLALPEWAPTQRNARFNECKKTLDGVVNGIIAERRRKGVHGDDLLGMLMEARDPETGEGMSDAQLRDEVMTMFLAGHETTANALSWTFALLSQHAAVDARAAAEVAEVLGDRAPTPADLARLPYLSAIIKESMRLYPPVWVVGRGAIEDTTLAGKPLRKGTYVFVSPWIMHRSPRLWDRALEFVPERWLDPTFKPHKCAYMPFITGPRKCIGDGFAIMEATFVLAMVLQRFTLSAERIPDTEPMITLRPKGGLPMIAGQRTPLRMAS